ncbi:MAG: hypothetical protein ACRCZI_04680 [Cetobacterium sp.]
MRVYNIDIINSYQTELEYIYDDFENRVINRDDLIEILDVEFENIKSDNTNSLLTDGKITKLESFGSSITRNTYIKFLMYQTMGADFINYSTIYKHFDVEFDSNQFPIFTKNFRYSQFKREALFLEWWIRNIITHPFISKFPQYIDFHLQEYLEKEILNLEENCRTDLLMEHLQISLEINEPHHSSKNQTVIDNEKISLNRLNGIAPLSLNIKDATNELVHNKTLAGIMLTTAKKATIISRIKKRSIFDDDFNEQYSDELNILIDAKLFAIFKKNKSAEFKTKIKTAIELIDSLGLSSNLGKMNTMIKDYYSELLRPMIHKSLLNSEYLKKFMDESIDLIISGLLQHEDVILEYQIQIFKASMIDKQYKNINAIKEFSDDCSDLCKTYNEIVDVIRVFNSSNEFTLLFELKKQSLLSDNQTIIKVDNFVQILNLDVNLIDDINKFIIKHIIQSKSALKLISWNDINLIISKYDGIRNDYKNMLLYYYTYIDSTYFDIISKLVNYYNMRLSSVKHFNNYMIRLRTKDREVFDKQMLEFKKALRGNENINDEMLFDLANYVKCIKEVKKIPVRSDMITENNYINVPNKTNNKRLYYDIPTMYVDISKTYDELMETIDLEKLNINDSDSVESISDDFDQYSDASDVE